MMRNVILLFSVDAEMEEAVDKAREMFAKLRDSNQAISPNMRWMVYSTGVKKGNEKDWQFAWKKYNNSQVI